MTFHFSLDCDNGRRGRCVRNSSMVGRLHHICAAIALPRSTVVARPPMSGVRGAAGSASTRSIARDDRAAASAWPRMLEHQRTRPDLADRVGDALAGDVGRRAVHRLEQRRVVALRIDVRRRRDADRAADRRAEIGQDVAEEIRADDDVEAVRPRTKCAVRMSMWYWSARTSGYCVRHRAEALVPVRHRDRDAVRLGRRRQVLLRRACARVRTRTSGCGRRPCGVNTDCWNTISRSVPSNIRPPTDEYSPSVFSRTTTKSMSPGLRFGERRRDARHQPARAQVDVLVEAAAELDQRAPQRNVVGNRGGPADRADRRSRRVRASLLEPVLRHHAAVLRVIVAAPVELVATRTRCRTSAPTASSTRRPSGTTSLPMPSPGMTAIRCLFIFVSFAAAKF